MSDALLPCPFCGKAARFFMIQNYDSWDHGGTGISCDTPGCAHIGLMWSRMGDCKPVLAEKWNTRQPAGEVAQHQWRHWPVSALHVAWTNCDADTYARLAASPALYVVRKLYLAPRPEALPQASEAVPTQQMVDAWEAKAKANPDRKP